MSFKINCLSDTKKQTILIWLFLTLVPTLLMLIVALFGNRDFYILAIIWFVLFCIFSLFGFGEIQWYYVDKEKIVVKNYLGIVNEVYFSKVKQIVDIELPVVKFKYQRCFIFIDKEKNIKDKIFWGNSYNSKSRCVRVPVCDELVETIERLGMSDIIFIPKKLF